MQRRRSNDLAQTLQTFVQAAGADHLGVAGTLSVFFYAERGQVSGDRALEMPRRHEVLLPLGRGLLVPLSADRLFVLVRGQHDPDPVLLASLARRPGHFQAVAGFTASLLSSSVQRKVLGNILRYVKAVAAQKSQNDQKRIYMDCGALGAGSCLLGHDHFLALSEAFPYEAHLIIEALHSVLTSADILRILVIDKLCSTVFANKDTTFVICNLIRV